MKTSINLTRNFSLLISIFIAFGLKAQDTLVKTNGQVIPCTILEVGTTGVSFKKTDFKDGPTYIELKSDIELIKYRNGKTETFPEAEKAIINTNAVNSNTVTQNSQTTSQTTSSNSQYQIIMADKKFYINGDKTKRREVNRLLSNSGNPAVIAPLKVAKLTRKFQILTTIIAYPSTITGSIASIATLRTLYFDHRNGTLTAKSWLNVGLSMLGTITFPITGKILKKKSGKLYTKAIDIYNVGKQ
jgi:hypothetical protein